MIAFVGVFVVSGFVAVVAIFFRLVDIHADIEAIRWIMEAAL